MTVYVRRWTTKDGLVKEAYRYDCSIRKPGEPEARRYKGTVPGTSLSRRAAESYERQVIASVLDGSHDAALAAKNTDAERCPTVAEYSPSFLAACESVDSQSGEREVRSKRAIITSYLIPFFGPTALKDISTEQISAFMNHQARTPKPKGTGCFRKKTITNHVAVLSGLLRHACPKHVERMPTIKWPRLPQPHPRFYTFEQGAALVEASKAEPFWHSMILVALRCGLRIGELQALEWRHIDLRAKTINVEQTFSQKVLKPPKNGRPRTVPLPPSVLEALSRHPRRLGSPWVWPSEDGDALKQNEVKHPMWRALKLAQLPADQWHICRHTYCSHLVMKGVHLVAVMQLAGHSSFSVTLRYAHLAPSIHADAVAKLDEPIAGHASIVSEKARG